MRWTKQQLLDHPKFGKLVLKNEDHREASSALAQPIVRDEPLAAAQRKENHAGRVLVSVTSFRRRLIDPDNLTPKYFIDCCRYAGFLRDDSAAEIELRVAQSKVKNPEDERTEIEITEI